MTVTDLYELLLAFFLVYAAIVSFFTWILWGDREYFK